MDSSRSCDQCGKPLPAEGRFCTHCGSFSGDSGTASNPGTATRVGPWERILERLRTVTASRYDVQRLLGWGGMAGVYLAEELRLKRRVAIKVIAPGLLMDPSQIERFEQEARTTAQLNHPHIVTIYEVDEREDLHYFTMTYVPGRALSQVMAEAAAPLPIPVVEAWVRQVAGALSYAHQRGVVHRDIKPGNILLDEHGNALVGDFGIAKVAEEPGLTRTGMLVGTPAYMSPEQCTTGKVTGASDQYSLGAVAYQLIVGAPPFSGSTIQVIQSHVGEPPRDLRELRPECPDTLADVVMRMLAKAPEERWPSLYDAVDAIGGRALRHDDPVRGVMAQLSAWTHGVRIEPPDALVGDEGASTLQPGDAHPFGAVALDYRGEVLPDRIVDWTVEPEGVLEVDGEGRVRALSPGRAKLVAASGRVRAEWAVKVGSSTSTGMITPPAGTPAPGGLVPGGDPEPTPGPPPPASVAAAPPVEPATPEPASPPESASPPEPAVPPTPAGPHERADSPASDAAPPDPERSDPPTPSAPEREERGPDLVMALDDEAGADEGDDPTATRVVAGGAPSAGGPPKGTPTPAGPVVEAPPPRKTPAAVPAAAGGADAERGGAARRMPLIAGMGVVGVAAVALVFALGGDDGGPRLPTDTGSSPDAAVAETESGPPAAADEPAGGGGDPAVPVAGEASDSVPGGESEPASPVSTPAEGPTTQAPASQAPPTREAPTRDPAPATPSTGAVRVTGDLPAGATVRIQGSGVDRVSAERTLRLAPGRYTLEVRADGFRPAVTDVTVAAGGTQDWRPSLTPLPTSTPAEPEPAAPSETAPPAADPAEVRATAVVNAIQAFGAALQSRDPARLRAAWPSISDADARPWEQFIGSRDIQDLRVTVTVPSVPEGSGDRVEVPFLLRLRYQSPGAPPPADPIPYRATVERSGDGWVLTGLRAGN